MSTADDPGPGPPPRRARRGPKPAAPLSVNPPRPPSNTVRLEERTQALIATLEGDKQELQSDVRRLQGRVDELGPQVSRLEEALDNAGANSVLATILTAVSGFAVSFATFTGEAATTWATGAAGCLLAGIAVAIYQAVQSRRRR